jgi:hypothetical protein
MEKKLHAKAQQPEWLLGFTAVPISLKVLHRFRGW